MIITFIPKFQKLSLLCIGFLTFLLAGCAVGPNFKNPQPEIPEKFRFAEVQADSIINLEWWSLFNDPIIDTLVNEALNNNKDILVAVARIEEARAALGFTKADIFPKLDIQGGASRGNSIGSFQFPNTTNNFYISPVLSWEIDFWGKFRRANESARAEMLASEYSLRTIQIGLISEVISTYFLLLDYSHRLEIAKRTLQTRIDGLDIIRQRFERGIIPEIDLNQAQIQKEIAEAAVPFFERAKTYTENALRILLGRNPGIVEKNMAFFNEVTPPEIPIGIPSTILERRPDVIRAKYQLMAQNAKIGVAIARRFPSISLTGLAGFASSELSTLTDQDLGWSLSGDLFGPIFNFNKNIARVEIEEARTKQALYNYEKTVLNSLRDVENALIEVKTYKQELEAKERQFKAAKNAETLSRQRYDKGVTSYLEVLEAERSSFDAELQLTEVRDNYFKAYVKLYKALGGGWITQKEKAEAERTQQEKPE
ncbi:MAG TPA: efflux transporter outer membrane subunit [Caldithrix abyssi]|uniref:Efflux transporter outer membrane subunit n=1 Tax=Caldithrix abyssi TaxID=187145 RepID=A0A7V4U2R8_CALAY|nr:efflux transporter outer membrane subunit [Caldithrix abyssi]